MQEIMSAGNEDGNTVLQLAVARKQIQVNNDRINHFKILFFLDIQITSVKSISILERIHTYIYNFTNYYVYIYL